MRLFRLNKLASFKGQAGYLPISKPTVWRWVKEGRLPKPISLGPKVTAWDLDEVDRYIEAQKQGAAS
jgi:prophage regulatory protein